MKFVLKTSIILVYCTLAVLAKGGGGGRGGGGTSSGGGRGTGGTGSTGGSTGGRPAGNTGGGFNGGTAGRTPNSVSSKGGTGTFSNGAPPAYSQTRSNYNNYAPAYGGNYSPASRRGYTGFYNPALIYFAIMPSFLFLGYYGAYHRYNRDDGYYYAPLITEQGSGTRHVMINGTTNSGKDDNYRYTFDISTDNQFPIADHAFYASSDARANPADFAYRLQTSQIVEFEDTNQNGFYDPNEPILSVTSLQNLNWENFMVSNITVPNRAGEDYLQTGTVANVVYNNTAPGGGNGNPNFNVRITYRASNLQLNNTAPIVMQPNSLQYDFAVENFPRTVAGSNANAKLAFAQVLSTFPEIPAVFDVNMTTPVDVANQIKTNLTYGISIGEYTQGRLEFQPTVNITDVGTVNTWTSMDANSLAGIPTYTEDDWIWGSQNPASGRVNKLLFVTVPGYSNGTGLINATYSGFGFLDTDVMNALANGDDVGSAGTKLISTKLSTLLLATIVATYFVI